MPVIATPPPPRPRTPADQYLALKAIAAGIGRALEFVEAQVDEVRAVFGSKSFESDLGTLGLTVRKPVVEFPDEGKLLAYLEQLDTDAEPLIIPARDEDVPEQIIPAHTIRHPARVIPSARAALAKRCKITAAGAVVDPDTGEILTFAAVKPGSEYWTARLTDDAKETAERMIVERLDAVTAILEPPRELDQ